MRVSMANLYRLLCWAWVGKLPSTELAGTGAEEADSPLDLLAGVFIREVDALLKRGLERRYRERRQDLTIPRGQPSIEDTLTRMLMPQGRLACTFEELSESTLANGLLLGTLERLARTDGLSRPAAVRRTLRRFPRVESVAPRPQRLSRVLLHRNNLAYRMPLHVAHLLATCSIPDERGSRWAFGDFTTNEQKMGSLFEAFVRNFWTMKQAAWKVTSPNLHFEATGPTEDLALLPEMRTDITLQDGPAAWVVECKCTARPYASYQKRTLRSAHLYQLLSYLHTRRASGSPAPGMLLYAQAGSPMRHDLVLNGEVVLVRSVDLGGSWGELEAELLAITEECKALPTWSPDERTGGHGHTQRGLRG